MTEVVLSDMGFNYPIVLTSFYTAITWAGTAVFHRTKRKKSKKEGATKEEEQEEEEAGHHQQQRRQVPTAAAAAAAFDLRQWALVSLLSVCTALNTLLGRANIAVPTTFDQMLQAVGPLLVLLIATRVFKHSVSSERKVAVIPIVVGVAMTWYNEIIEVSGSAALVSVVCIVLNAVRVVINSEMLTGESKVTPLHLLSRLSPMTLAQVSTFALFHGEVSGMVGQWRVILAGWAPHVIVLTGLTSFVMTVLSMHATTFATPLTVSVMGALKQVLVVIFTVVRMNRSVSRLNVLGLLLVLIGVVRYTIVSRKEKRKREGVSAKKVKAPAMGQEQRQKLVVVGTKTGVYPAGASAAAPVLPTTGGVPTVGGGGGGEDDGQREKVRRFASVSGLWSGEKGASSRRNR